MIKETRILLVYVWELPVRIFHWINALSVMVLIVTGLIIGNPPAILTSQEAYMGYWFGWVRFLHFSAAYIFFFIWIYRLFWSFMGNADSSWRCYLPFTKAHWMKAWEAFKTDIIQINDKPVFSTGHNHMALTVYFLLFLVSLFQMLTGFAMYAAMSDWWVADFFTWILPIMESEGSLRYWHHLSMWFFILFLIVHLYLIFHHDYVERKGVLSSIIGGWKFITDATPPEEKP
ncbi:MAG: Ni/Fe-hydrogenase, b-type cytochrome subunit [Deltaproteobacteria bacterium]|nr:Ni/Fe-hydrogenase, b-type cytochrome subunit [Deltaproteobacteria bacterium]